MTIEKNETIACDLSVFTPRERADHLTEAEKLRAAALGFMRLDAGVEIYFRSDMEPERLERWASNELRCCAFLSGAHTRREEDRVVLTLEAPGEGARIWSKMYLSTPASVKADEGACGC